MGEWKFARRQGGAPSEYPRCANDQPRSKYRPKSTRAPARYRTKLRFCATKPGKPARGLALNIRFQRFANDGRLLLDAGILLRLREKLVVYRNGSFHRFKLLGVEYNIVRCCFPRLVCCAGVALQLRVTTGAQVGAHLRMTAALLESSRPASPARFPAARRCGRA